MWTAEDFLTLRHNNHIPAFLLKEIRAHETSNIYYEGTPSSLGATCQFSFEQVPVFAECQVFVGKVPAMRS